MPDQGSCSKLIEPCGVGSVTVPVAGLHGSVVVLSGAPDNSGMLSASSSSRTVSDSALYGEAVVRSKPIHGWRVKRLLHKRPKKSRALDDAVVKISAEEYEYEIFRSPEEYQEANLEPPRYDLPEKYTPQRAAVTVAVRSPLPEAGSRGSLRSETRMAHSVTDLFARAKDGDEIHRREVAPLKKSLAKREQRIKELEGKLRTTEETGRRILERADLGEKILTDPVLLTRHICRGQETGEAVLAAISRTPIGEDLMYEFGTWAFNSGRKAMQNDVRTALEVAINDADLPRILAVLPEEVPDPGPTPFTSVPEGRTLPVPIVEVAGVCVKCGVKFGEFFCEICRFYDDDWLKGGKIKSFIASFQVKLNTCRECLFIAACIDIKRALCQMACNSATKFLGDAGICLFSLHVDDLAMTLMLVDSDSSNRPTSRRRWRTLMVIDLNPSDRPTSRRSRDELMEARTFSLLTFIQLITSSIQARDSVDTPKRSSKRLAERARQEALQQRKIAHGGHEVGDTQEDPLLILSDEEKEVTVQLPPKSETFSPVNPDYDFDYQEFLTEFLADESLTDTPPTPPYMVKSGANSPIVPTTAPGFDPPSPPS
nr:leucine zipper putative tumor suppressor 2-like [Ipomoea batatas]